MIKISKPIKLEVTHRYSRTYTINGLQLLEDDGTTITFKNYAQMSRYLGMTRQGLYNKIRANMNLIDVLAERLKNYRNEY